MKRILIVLSVIFFLIPFIYSQNLKLEREIDLSHFLKPYQPHFVFVSLDTQGNIFITQRGKDSFLKLNPSGEIIQHGPQKIEGEITRFDVDSNGNPVCLLTGRMTPKYFYLPLVWFDGISGQKIREINLGEMFNLVTHFQILRPNDLILVNGIAKDVKLPRNSLHLLDFNLNLIKSFSPLKEQLGDTPSLIDKNPDYFAVAPKFDPDNQIIFQAFPGAGLIRYFDLNGNQVGETEWVGRNVFLVHTGDLWFKDKDGFMVFKKKGNRFEPAGLSLKEDKGSSTPGYPVAQDTSGRIYFLGGDKSQTLKIYVLEN